MNQNSGESGTPVSHPQVDLGFVARVTNPFLGSLPSDEDEIKHASDIIGDWGPLQRNVVIFYILTYIVSPFHNKGIVLYVPTLDYWCKKPHGYENATLQQCFSYEDDRLPCTEWEYDLSFYSATATNEYDLVCEREWLMSMSASVYQLGYAISSIFVGILSDKYGRLLALKAAVFLEIISGVYLSLAPSIGHFLLGRFTLGVAAYGRYLTGAILVMELVGPKHRDTIRCLIEAGSCMGYLMVPWVNYLVPNFRYIQFGLAAYEYLFVAWMLNLPESPRWQLTHGKFTDAKKTIMTAVEMKGGVDEETLNIKLSQLRTFLAKEEKLREEESKKSILDLWRHHKYQRYCLALYFIWFANMFVYYGFAYNAGVIGGSLHFNIFVQAVAETSIIIILYFTINHLPRKLYTKSLLLCCAVATAAMIPFSFTDAGLSVRIILSFVGKMAVSGVTQLLYVHTPEIFPTTLRQIGVGSCSVAARIGSTLAPFTKELAQATHLSVMMAVMATLAFSSSFLTKYLPETRNMEMPDTIFEAKRNLSRKGVSIKLRQVHV